MTSGAEGGSPGLNLSPEERLLLACAVPPELLDPETLARLAAEVTDWPDMTRKALRAKLGPLVFARLSETSLTRAIPRPLFMQLAAVQVAAEGTNRRILGLRDRLLPAFAGKGLHVLPLKGCALADTLYRDPSLRPMGDLDLLIREEEIPSAVPLLREFGYRTEGENAPGEYLFVHEEAQPHLDAHTALDPSGRFGISTPDLWEAAGPLPANSAGSDPMAAPAPEWETLSVQHLFVHSLIHAARHRLDSLVPLVDAAWIAARWPEQMGWDSLPDLARRWRCREALAFALEAAVLLFGLPVPEEARRKLALRGWRRRIVSRLWPGESPLQSLETRPPVVRYAFSALTTSWPGGFIGAMSRFGPERRMPAEKTTSSAE